MNGTAIKRLREEKGLSQRAVAIATGLTETTLYDLERGKAKNPTFKTIQAVADFYGIKVSELIGEK